MALPLVCYKSMLSTSTITDPGTETGYDIDDLYDLRSYKGWKSDQVAAAINIDIDAGVAGADADYIGLVNHNLYTLGATVRVLGDNATPPVTERLAPVTPSEDTVSVKTWTAPGAVRYWRVTINHAALPFSAAPFIMELFLGLKTELPQYIAPSFNPFFSGIEVAGSRSEGGHYLGATTRGKTHRGTLTFGEAGAPRASFTSDLNAFLDNHALLRKPFIFIFDTADSDFSTARYIKMTDDSDAERYAVGGCYANFTLSLEVEEAYMEPAS